MIIKLLYKVYRFTNSVFNFIFNFIILLYFQVEYKKNPTINGRLYLRNYGKFILKNNIKFNSGIKFNVIGGQEKMQIIIKENAKLKIGNNSGISNSTIVCHKNIDIGEEVYIGGNCKIYDTDFHSLNRKKRLSKNDTDIKTESITIKSGVFIGAHSIILKGVTIGKNSVIGAGSVVTRDIPDNEVWAGNPVKFIKKVD